jgi:hypothetical protein
MTMNVKFVSSSSSGQSHCASQLHWVSGFGPAQVEAVVFQPDHRLVAFRTFSRSLLIGVATLRLFASLFKLVHSWKINLFWLSPKTSTQAIEN